MTLQELYDYIYGKKASFVAPSQPQAITADRHQKNIEKKQEEFKNNIKNAFKALTETPHLSRALRERLKKESATDLEKILYSDEAEKPENTDTNTPPDETKEELNGFFNKLNFKYKFFDESNQSELGKAREKYLVLYKALNLFIQFDEKQEINRSELQEQAYKAMVLFGASNDQPLKETSLYLINHGSQFSRKMHDSLLWPLPINNPPIKLDKWQKLIRASGKKAVELFQEAPKIEVHLEDKPNWALKEVEDAASKLRYKRADENKELAMLCLHYKVPEATFNRCLMIQQGKAEGIAAIKTHDNLPDTHIDGATLNPPLSGYHLVKLPPEDPRTFILGYMTNCCQSIDGHSEQCVIDSLTRENNGIYVLLRSTKMASKAPPFIKTKSPDGRTINKINYDEYTLVGQGYAWRSKDGDLVDGKIINGDIVFDSWENLSPERDDRVIEPFLEAFAKKNPELIQVLIGLGGKTPISYRQKRADWPQEMAEGFNYGDAKVQGLVYRNEELLRKLESTLQTELELDASSKITLFSRSEYNDFLSLKGLFKPTILSSETVKKIISFCSQSQQILYGFAAIAKAGYQFDENNLRELRELEDKYKYKYKYKPYYFRLACLRAPFLMNQCKPPEKDMNKFISLLNLLIEDEENLEKEKNDTRCNGFKSFSDRDYCSYLGRKAPNEEQIKKTIEAIEKNNKNFLSFDKLFLLLSLTQNNCEFLERTINGLLGFWPGTILTDRQLNGLLLYLNTKEKNHLALDLYLSSEIKYDRIAWAFEKNRPIETIDALVRDIHHYKAIKKNEKSKALVKATQLMHSIKNKLTPAHDPRSSSDFQGVDEKDFEKYGDLFLAAEKGNDQLRTLLENTGFYILMLRKNQPNKKDYTRFIEKMRDYIENPTPIKLNYLAAIIDISKHIQQLKDDKEFKDDDGKNRPFFERFTEIIHPNDLEKNLAIQFKNELLSEAGKISSLDYKGSKYFKKIYCEILKKLTPEPEKNLPISQKNKFSSKF